MCKVISVCNQKGGVGKSASAANLGIGLARAGQKVLVIDNDAQGSLTASLGFNEPDNMEYTLATVLGKIIKEESYDPEEGILHHQEGIDLMPGNIELSGIDLTLVSVMSREHVLSEYIESIKDRYSWIIIDCAPSLGMLTVNALAASDSVLVPVQVGFLPAKGLEQLIRTINKVRKQKINRNLRIEGILLTMVDGRTNYSKEIISLIEQAYGGNVRIFEKPIPLSVRVAECSALGVSIYRNDPKGKAALGYESLTKEILGNPLNGGGAL